MGWSARPNSKEPCWKTISTNASRKISSGAEKADTPSRYRECHDVVKEVLAAAQVTCFSNFYSGDPYIGGREDLLKKNEEIASLQKEVKQLKIELS